MYNARTTNTGLRNLCVPSSSSRARCVGECARWSPKSTPTIARSLLEFIWRGSFGFRHVWGRPHPSGGHSAADFGVLTFMDGPPSGSITADQPLWSTHAAFQNFASSDSRMFLRVFYDLSRQFSTSRDDAQRKHCVRLANSHASRAQATVPSAVSKKKKKHTYKTSNRNWDRGHLTF